KDLPKDQCRWLFYVLADEDGGHAFSVTLAQHEANIAAAREAGLL
ncbi:MAG: YceG-like family, partial [Actinomycetota bacterium]